ncbi:phosphatase PAP2 family protein [Frankia nepalensis]|uniref:phosphatase PAP2 family protein n=1 Tax=Frankia nepalensis TaxID=1836974 RepID=UPI00288BB3A1|nr:phosphatase PAP2 family protein [Frankia nepalensis]
MAGGAGRLDAPEDTATTRADRWRRRLRDPATGRPVWWVEIVILVAMYYCYTGTRGFAEGSVSEATRTGETLLRWQEAVGLDIELGLNHWLHSVPAIAIACCYYYATLHFIVTPAVILWMHRRHPRRYSRARWALVFTTLLCLTGFFLFPTAPPRLLPGAGFTDTMAEYHNWGWWSATASAAPTGLDKVANLYAAMPSLHCAWALWCGVLIARNARWRWVRVLGVLYPAGTVFVVMATANHYILDAFAGWAVLGVSTLAAIALTRRSARRFAPDGPSAPLGGGSPRPPDDLPHPSGPDAPDALADGGDSRPGEAPAQPAPRAPSNGLAAIT